MGLKSRQGFFCETIGKTGVLQGSAAKTVTCMYGSKTRCFCFNIFYEHADLKMKAIIR